MLRRASADKIEVRQISLLAARAALLGSILLIAACTPVADPSAGLPPDESIALIDQVESTSIDLTTIAEAFALNTRATEVQRENLLSDLLGRRAEWQIPVYEISREGERYHVKSQPIPVTDANAVALIRVFAVVIPRGPADEALLESARTDDAIRVRGIVQEIRLRTIVAIVPAVVVGVTST